MFFMMNDAASCLDVLGATVLVARISVLMCLTPRLWTIPISTNARCSAILIVSGMSGPSGSLGTPFSHSKMYACALLLG